MNDIEWPNWNFNKNNDTDESDAEFKSYGYEPPKIVYPMQITDNIYRYRSPGDDINVVRINISDPPHCTRIGKNIPVAGVSFRLDHATNFVFGSAQKIGLRPEPDNQFDPNAIMVIGKWQNSDGEQHKEHVGYVPKRLAAEIALLHNPKYTDIFAVLKTMFVPHQGKGPGIRMDIWKPDILFKENDALLELTKNVIKGEQKTLGIPPNTD